MKPVIRNYQRGSFVYLEGNMSDEIYVLNKGSISLEYIDIISQIQKKEHLSQGDFFGVRSVLSHSPRMETAKVMADSEILVMKESYFLDFCKKSPKLLSDMLKIYSSELRTVHSSLRKYTDKNSTTESSDLGIFNCGKFYYKLENNDFAKYILQKYKDMYPTGKLVHEVDRILDAMQRNISYKELYSSS